MLRAEPESEALADWLDDRPEARLISSVLAEVELRRALRRTEPDLIDEVPALLEHLDRYEIDAGVRRCAASFIDPGLRSLDAIHLATATLLAGRGLDAFVSYDRRLLAAAEAESLPVASPGAAEAH